ncbi:MAG TPA: hypothetical protein VGI04_10095 [Neobacillus sp.]
MDKKQRISWGVSFGSLALVAGMVSYLGLSNVDKTNNQMTSGQSLPFNDNSNQQSQGGFISPNGQDQGQNFDNSFNGNQSSQFDINGDSSPNNSDPNHSFSGNSNGQNQFSNGSRSFGGHHRGFDTTTGGT